MLKTQFYLSIQGQTIALSNNTQLTQSDIPQLNPQNYDNIVAQVNPNPKNPEILGLKNCSIQVWETTLPNGEIRQIQTGQTIKLEDNTQINFGLVNGIITHQDASRQVVSDQDIYKSKDKKKKGTPKLVIIGSIIIAAIILPLVWASPLLISLLLNTKTETSLKEETASTQSNSCDIKSLTTKREALGIDSWIEVNKIFWERTGYSFEKPIDRNHPNYNSYRKQWCKIADKWLSEKESQNSSSSTENLVTNLSNTNKNWQGYFDSKAAILNIDFYKISDNRKIMSFTGKMKILYNNNDYHHVAIKGRIDADSQNISFQETEVIAQTSNDNWALGSNQGRISTNSYGMLGDGSDTKGDHYSWCFDHVNAVKTCTNEQAKNVPTPEPSSSVDSTAPELSERKAAILINQWLQAKQRIFGSSHDKNLIAKIFTGKAHEKVQRNVNEIEQNQEYYIFEKQEVKRIDNFSETVRNEARIDVTLNESYKLYNNQGKVDSQENNQENSEYYGIMRVHLVYSENQWKIADFYNIKELQHPKYD